MPLKNKRNKEKESLYWEQSCLNQDHNKFKPHTQKYNTSIYFTTSEKNNLKCYKIVLKEKSTDQVPMWLQMHIES